MSRIPQFCILPMAPVSIYISIIYILCIMYFRYLLHGNHVKPSHIPLIGSPDVYSQFATKVISLRPSVCIAAENLYLERVVYHPVNDSTDGNTIGGSWFKKKSPPVNPLSSNVIDIAYISMESSYFIELCTARKAIESCARACKCWSNHYNSCTVSKDNKETVSTSSSNHSNIHRREITISRPPGHKRKGHGSTGVLLNSKAGVFIKVLLEKLSRMLAQPPRVNLLLTKLISRLCHYPHPLLTSFLLNHSVTLLQAVPDLPLVSVCVHACVYDWCVSDYLNGCGFINIIMIFKLNISNQILFYQFFPLHTVNTVIFKVLIFHG